MPLKQETKDFYSNMFLEIERQIQILRSDFDRAMKNDDARAFQVLVDDVEDLWEFFFPEDEDANVPNHKDSD